MSYFVGLTGGIGSGKSTVANLFAELGVPVIDTDAISHQLTQPGGAAIPAILAVFGKEYIDATGALDRSKMRQLIFSNPAAKLKMEELLHPLILTQAKAQAQAACKASTNSVPYILIVVPLLFETAAYQDWLDHTVTVDCAEHTQISRAAERDGLSEQAITAIVAQQLSRPQRLKMANDTLNNDGTLPELSARILELHMRFLKLAASSN